MGEKADKGLGRLTALGIRHAWQVALYLPEKWTDFRRVCSRLDSVSADASGYVNLAGVVSRSPNVTLSPPPRLTSRVRLSDGSEFGFTAFGDTRELEKQLSVGRQIVIRGKLADFNGHPWLSDVSIIPDEWMGRLRPEYAGKKGVIGSELVGARVVGMLPFALEHTANWLREALSISESEILDVAQAPGGWSLNDVLSKAHMPKAIPEGERAQLCMERLAAYGVFKGALSGIESASTGAWCSPVDPASVVSALPFPLTGEQLAAVHDALEDVRSGAPMHRVISGDVGSGKTAVYGSIAACCARGGARVAVMAPSKTLAKQIHRELSSYWPDLNVTLVLPGQGGDLSSAFLVGTTALLHLKDRQPLDLVVVDEQHKFSREQRELMKHDHTHLLEVSATCIPRSQALMRYGVVKVSKLSQCHVEKKIETKLWAQDERRDLFDRVKDSLSKDWKLLVIYPKKEDNGNADMPSAGEAFATWERLFPGQVRLAHGGRELDDNEASIMDLREGRARILISTTVVEVGLTIPGLRHAFVMHPERFGLTTLHQIRGRVAREGGPGRFDMFLPRPVSDKADARLRVLESTSDGFEVAEKDLYLRGFGDLSGGSDRQTGADETFLFGRSVRLELVDEMLARFAADSSSVA